MQKEKPSECALFNEWYLNLPFNQRTSIVKIIADRCGVTTQYVENWRWHKPIRPLYQKLINEIYNEKIF